MLPPKRFPLFFGCLLLLFTVNSFAQRDARIEARVDSVLALMTLDEKVGQMNQYTGFYDATGPTPQIGTAAEKYADLRLARVGSMLNVAGVSEIRALQKIAVEETRLGIPILFAYDVIHGYKTQSPIPLAEAASWDLEAIEASARLAAREASAAGLNWTFAPMVDISRDPRWGRVMEGAGEDPYLGSRIAEARVRGFQGDDLSDPSTVLACAKHFVGYGFPTAGRDYSGANLGDHLLYNVILPPFIAAKRAGVRTFMNAFNEVNGIPATGNQRLLRQILKGDWGFDGFVISDWDSVGEMWDHGYAANDREAAKHAALAGCDMDMESYAYLNHLKDLVESGEVPESVVDEAVRRILRAKFELGLFDDPFRYLDEERERQEVGSAANRAQVLEMALKSMVLLKNENKLLPLAKSGQQIALIGPLADETNSPLGSWRLAADDSTAVSVLAGLNSYSGNDIRYERGVQLTTGRTEFVWETPINETDTSGMGAAVALAAQSDVVVMVLGEHGFLSGEARSRTELDLPGLQQELLEAVYAVNPNVVLVLMNGRPLALPWAAENVPAILEAWQLGTESGNAIAQVLYGDYNPSGKLPMTYPRSVGQIPIFYSAKNTGRPTPDRPQEVFWSHYIDSENTPLYPFGHGLSYTDFQYDALTLSSDSLYRNEPLNISLALTNTGDRPGREVVQLYIRDHFGSATRPLKELKGFQLVDLQPGETKEVKFELTESDLRFYTPRGRWEAETGDFTVFVGGSSDMTLEADFHYSDAYRGRPNLIWEDDFDGTILNPTYWNFALGNGCPRLCGWGNNEPQIYTSTNHTVQDGLLTITARKEGDQYSSTRITTKGKVDVQYGRIEARMQLPTGKGVWPAFWMLGSNIDEVGWPLCGEIDIMEYVGREPDILHTTVHTESRHQGNGFSQETRIPTIEEGFHVFAVEWTSEKMDFFVDDQKVFTFEPEEKTENLWPFDQPFYILLNLAIGGNFGGPEVDDSIFPQEYVVDYIRIYGE